MFGIKPQAGEFQALKKVFNIVAMVKRERIYFVFLQIITIRLIDKSWESHINTYSSKGGLKTSQIAQDFLLFKY